jgi:hypothetical protein
MLKSDIKWQDFASCNGIEGLEVSDPFYDEYESDVVVAMNTDQMCFHCPVAKQCLEDGIENSDWGVHGGVYLVYGKIDMQRNCHKNTSDWERLEEIHGYTFDESDKADSPVLS